MNAYRFKKLLAVILCIYFVMVSFLSLFFISIHKNHDCIGENCVVCCQLENAKKTLKQLITGVVNGAILFLIFTTLILCIIGGLSNRKIVSLVTLKIRMDN